MIRPIWAAVHECSLPASYRDTCAPVTKRLALSTTSPRLLVDPRYSGCRRDTIEITSTRHRIGEMSLFWDGNWLRSMDTHQMPCRRSPSIFDLNWAIGADSFRAHPTDRHSRVYVDVDRQAAPSSTLGFRWRPCRRCQLQRCRRVHQHVCDEEPDIAGVELQYTSAGRGYVNCTQAGTEPSVGASLACQKGSLRHSVAFSKSALLLCCINSLRIHSNRVTRLSDTWSSSASFPSVYPPGSPSCFVLLRVAERCILLGQKSSWICTTFIPISLESHPNAAAPSAPFPAIFYKDIRNISWLEVVSTNRGYPQLNSDSLTTRICSPHDVADRIVHREIIVHYKKAP